MFNLPPKLVPALPDPTWIEDRWIDRNLPTLQVYRDPVRGLVFSIGPTRYAQRFTLPELTLMLDAATEVESRLGT